MRIKLEEGIIYLSKLKNIFFRKERMNYENKRDTRM